MGISVPFTAPTQLGIFPISWNFLLNSRKSDALSGNAIFFCVWFIARQIKINSLDFNKFITLSRKIFHAFFETYI